MAQRFFTLVFLFICTLLPAQASLFSSKTQFVPVDQAFTFDFKQQEHKLDLTWQIKPGYYLYRQQIKIEPHQAKIA
ncbi:MAG: protein-disulfide reductase DsbD, partial [Enterobacterales bacterium]|nr:protein-disulfide reductase DsbD [Enterobacterales bacterium]